MPCHFIPHITFCKVTSSLANLEPILSLSGLKLCNPQTKFMWSKSLPSSPLCSDQALKSLLRPASKRSPLLLLPQPSGLSVLTSSMISSTLSRLPQSLKLDPSAYDFHCFRRSGVSWTADNNVSLDKLKAHGVGPLLFKFILKHNLNSFSLSNSYPVC